MSSASYPRQRAHCMAFHLCCSISGAKLSSDAALCNAVPCPARLVTNTRGLELRRVVQISTLPELDHAIESSCSCGKQPQREASFIAEN